MTTHLVRNFPNVPADKIALVRGVLVVKQDKVLLTNAEKIATFPKDCDLDGEVITVDKVETKN